LRVGEDRGLSNFFNFNRYIIQLVRTKTCLPGGELVFFSLRVKGSILATLQKMYWIYYLFILSRYIKLHKLKNEDTNPSQGVRHIISIFFQLR
jgi:hypothetical protein